MIGDLTVPSMWQVWHFLCHLRSFVLIFLSKGTTSNLSRGAREEIAASAAAMLLSKVDPSEFVVLLGLRPVVKN